MKKINETEILKSLIEGNELFYAPVKTSRPDKSAYEFIIGIGNDHYASVIMTVEAYQELIKNKPTK